MSYSLPLDMILAIAEYLTPTDLAPMCLLNHEISQYALPVLYRNITLKTSPEHQSSTLALLRGLDENRCWPKSFLSKYAHRTRSLALEAPPLPEDRLSCESRSGNYRFIRSLSEVLGAVLPKFSALREFSWPFTLACSSGVYVQSQSALIAPDRPDVSYIREALMWQSLWLKPRLEKVVFVAEAEHPGHALLLPEFTAKKVAFEAARGLGGKPRKVLDSDLAWGAIKFEVALSTPAASEDAYLGMARPAFDEYCKHLDKYAVEFEKNPRIGREAIVQWHLHFNRGLNVSIANLQYS